MGKANHRASAGEVGSVVEMEYSKAPSFLFFTNPSFSLIISFNYHC
jgi:hypothetical protein